MKNLLTSKNNSSHISTDTSFSKTSRNDSKTRNLQKRPSKEFQNLNDLSRFTEIEDLKKNRIK